MIEGLPGVRLHLELLRHLEKAEEEEQQAMDCSSTMAVPRCRAVDIMVVPCWQELILEGQILEVREIVGEKAEK